MADRTQPNPNEPIDPPPASQARIRSARRLLRRKDRKASGQFLAEGPQVVREALAAGLVTEIFVSESGLHSGVLTSVGLTGATAPPAGLLGDREFAELAGTVTPQGVLAVCRQHDVDLDDWLPAQQRTPRLVVCCAEIRDPGNAGTVIRCADAAGADAVILGVDSVDLYNPKTVRASTGSIFHLPIITGAELPTTLEALRSRGLQIFAATGNADSDLDGLAVSGELAHPTAWLMGNEAHGLDHDQLRLADRSVAVPMYGRAESLNLSTAAAVCLYATASAQRRTVQET